MPEKFTGQVEIQDSASPPKARITLSGDAGTARFSGEGHDGPLTAVTNDRIVIGKKPPPPLRPGDDLPLLDDTELELAPDDGGGMVGPKTSLTIGDETLPGGLFIIGANGGRAFGLNSVTASLTVGGEGNAGDVFILDDQGDVRIRLNGTTGDIELTGADCAEEFNVDGNGEAIEPGTVMRIGEDVGVRPSDSAYDKRVAGIVSGAGPYRPGIVLDKVRGRCERVALALSGKAYCKVDANYAPVEIGDLLTTSSTSGHAMKAGDPFQAFGTVIGKALQGLPSGRGLIPVLIALH